MYIVLGSMYETMSISTGLYPNLDLWNANKLHYVTLQVKSGTICYLYLFIKLRSHKIRLLCVYS